MFKAAQDWGRDTVGKATTCDTGITHDIWVLVGVPAVPPPIQLSADVFGKTMEDSPSDEASIPMWKT